MRKIYHIAQRNEWEGCIVSQKDYWPLNSGNQKFIHFSFSDQLLKVANFRFKGTRDLLVLEAESMQFGDHLKIEPNPPDPEVFPHLYRPLRFDEVLKVHSFPTRADGKFDLPRDIK